MKGSLISLTLLLLLTACGPPLVWDKPGLGGEAKSMDQTECQSLAWRQAVAAENDLMFRYRMSSGRMSSGRYATRYGYFPQNNFGRYDWEDRFFSTCMQAKGYRLVPLQQGGDKTPAAPHIH